MNRWYANETKEQIKNRDCVYRKAIFKGIEEDWKIYRGLRNETVQLIRKKKKLYYENLIDSKK